MTGFDIFTPTHIQFSSLCNYLEAKYFAEVKITYTTSFDGVTSTEISVSISDSEMPVRFSVKHTSYQTPETRKKALKGAYCGLDLIKPTDDLTELLFKCFVEELHEEVYNIAVKCLADLGGGYITSDIYDKTARAFTQVAAASVDSNQLDCGWISVNEKLPPLDTNVLCWCGYPCVSYLFGASDGYAWSDGCRDVSYWRPLPEEPQTNKTSIFGF